SRELVGHHAHGPPGRIGGALGAVGQDFGGRLALVAVTEGTEALAGGLDRRAAVIGGALAPIAGDDDPTSGYGVFTQFRHQQSSSVAPVKKGIAVKHNSWMRVRRTVDRHHVKSNGTVMGTAAPVSPGHPNQVLALLDIHRALAGKVSFHGARFDLNKYQSRGRSLPSNQVHL